MSRFDRLSTFAVSTFALLATAGSPAAGQSCIGDCDSGGSVTVDELLVGLNIALGVDGLNACQAFDKRGDGTIEVDELVEGVQNALQGCPSSRVVKASSSVALSSIYVMDFGSLSSNPSGAAQSSVMTSGPILPVGSGGGEGVQCYTLFCPLGGTELRCCGFGVLTFDWSQCVLDDGTEVSGSYSVESDDADACLFGLPDYPTTALAPPSGIHFFIEFTDYSAATGDFFGNFSVFQANFYEEFEPFGAECSLIFPDDPLLDPLGFAIRGDGTRYLNGSVRTISGSGPSIVQDIGTTFGTETAEVSADVIIDEFSALSCLVDTQLDGTFSTTNLLTGREFTESYEEFIVTEAADSDGSYLIALDGTSTTDCLGEVLIRTSEPLKIFPDASCPVGGQLDLEPANQEPSTIFYTDTGGVQFDFESDGFIEETRSSCIDVAANECSVQQAQGVCTGCAGASDCGSGLVCAPCILCEEGAPSRCAPQDDFASCDDGIFGQLFIDFEL